MNKSPDETKATSLSVTMTNLDEGVSAHGGSHIQDPNTSTTSHAPTQPTMSAMIRTAQVLGEDSLAINTMEQRTDVTPLNSMYSVDFTIDSAITHGSRSNAMVVQGPLPDLNAIQSAKNTTVHTDEKSEMDNPSNAANMPNLPAHSQNTYFSESMAPRNNHNTAQTFGPQSTATTYNTTNTTNHYHVPLLPNQKASTDRTNANLWDTHFFLKILSALGVLSAFMVVLFLIKKNGKTIAQISFCDTRFDNGSIEHAICLNRFNFSFFSEPVQPAIPDINHKISSKNNELQKKICENEEKNLQDNQEDNALAGATAVQPPFFDDPLFPEYYLSTKYEKDIERNLSNQFLSKNLAILAITGIPGSGKSMHAKKYLLNYQERHFDGKYFIMELYAENNYQWEESLTSLAEKLVLSQKNIKVL